MNLNQLYQEVVAWPGPLAINGMFAAGCILLLASGVLSLSGRFRWVVRGLALLGCLTLMAPAAVIQLQIITERQAENVISRRPRYREAIRTRAQWVLIGVPCAAVGVSIASWVARQQRLRAQVPHRLKLAYKHAVEGNHAAALAEYSQALAIAPHLSEAYCARGRLYKTLGDKQLARDDFDRAITRDPRHYRSRLERATLRIEEGEIDSALEDLERVLRVNDPECHLLRGICYYRKGDLENAYLDFTRVVKLTNHTDFAEPARQYIEQIDQARANGSPHSPPVNGVASNALSDLADPTNLTH